MSNTEAATYPPFSGDEPMCSKCGHEGATTKFIAHGHCAHPDIVTGFKPNERLHRSCLRCDYQWDEAVAP